MCQSIPSTFHSAKGVSLGVPKTGTMAAFDRFNRFGQVWGFSVHQFDGFPLAWTAFVSVDGFVTADGFGSVLFQKNGFEREAS